MAKVALAHHRECLEFYPNIYRHMFSLNIYLHWSICSLSDLSEKVIEIERAEVKDGGEGALIIKLKNL